MRLFGLKVMLSLMMNIKKSKLILVGEMQNIHCELFSPFDK